MAYSNISVMRQQIWPDHRVPGIANGKDWSSNGEFYRTELSPKQSIFNTFFPAIPDHASMQWIMGAPSYAEVEAVVDRMKNCPKRVFLVEIYTQGSNSCKSVPQLWQRDAMY
jgi:hypothetical protein